MFLTIIIMSMIGVVLLNWLALGWTLVGALCWTAAETGIQFAIIILFAILAGLCVPHKFYHENKLYAVSKREISFYRAIGLPAWKDHVLELGMLGGFSKKKLRSSDDPAYVERFIYELNKGMFVHTIGTAASFLILALPLPGFWSITLPVALVGALLNILPLMVLRYNKPRLLMLKKRLARQQGVA